MKRLVWITRHRGLDLAKLFQADTEFTFRSSGGGSGWSLFSLVEKWLVLKLECTGINDAVY
jgi:hypothetical protein